jgi:nicotinate-nucleotide adenylyltransferase
MKTGLFGGTFDPIHVGHLIVAETVRCDLSLDRILFVVAAVPYHKVRENLSPAFLRLEMVELALEGYPLFTVSDVEVQRGGVSYTVETVRWFQDSEEWGKDELYLLIGSDCLLELGMWKDPEEILNNIPTLVVERPGFDIKKAEQRFGKRVTGVQAPLIDISSTDIRRRVRAGKSIKFWVPEKVEEYIMRKGLYR